MRLSDLKTAPGIALDIAYFGLVGALALALEALETAVERLDESATP